MRIAIFGATGQFGRAISRTLSGEGHTLSALVRRTNVDLPEKLRVQTADQFDREVMAEHLRGVDLAIYAIGRAEQWVPDPSIFWRINVELFERFLQALAKAGTPALMYLSTFETFASIDGRIRESHSAADPEAFSPYYRSMFAAFGTAREFADRHGTRLVTLHPSAAYGGRNTGRGLTDYLENLMHRRYWRVPFIPPTRFPLVHVDSLADAARRALHEEGAYIVSDGVTSLRGLARTMRALGGGFVPPQLPLPVVRLAATALELVARLTGIPPLMAHVQLDYLAAGHAPIAEKARSELGWEPLPLDVGIERFLEDRSRGGAANVGV